MPNYRPLNDNGMFFYAHKYRDHWQGRGPWYWVWRLIQEVCELVGALIGLHSDSVDHELRQIGSICINWLRNRNPEPEMEVTMEPIKLVESPDVPDWFEDVYNEYLHTRAAERERKILNLDSGPFQVDE